MTKAGYEWGKALRSIENYARLFMDNKEYRCELARERALDIIDTVMNLRLSNKKRILRMWYMLLFNYKLAIKHDEIIYFEQLLMYMSNKIKSTEKEIEDYENEKNNRV